MRIEKQAEICCNNISKVSVKSMDRINVNTASTKEVCYSTTEENVSELFSKGQVVEGVITNVSDKISISLNGKELQVSQSAVQNAKEGQVRTFEITDFSNKSIVLREVGNEAEQPASQGVKQTSVVTSSATFIGKLDDTKNMESLGTKKEQVKKQMAATASRLSAEDYAKLSEDKTPLEEYNEDRVERAIDRVKAQREFKQEHLDKQIEKKQETRELITEASSKTGKGSQAAKIEKQLEENNLPVTEANLTKMATAMELAAMAPQMSDASKAYIIENNMQVTPENIYKSIYSGSGMSTGMSINEQTWKELQPQVEDLLVKEGMEVTSESLNNAKWLISNDLTVTKQNIETLSELNELQNNMDPDLMFKLCINGLKEGTEPKKTDLVEQRQDLDLRQKAMETMALLASIEDNAVNCVTEGEPITLQALANVSDTTTSETVNIAAITARRQLEEVRLKLTMESSYQLYKQGIDVDTTELQELVENLRAMEDAYYQGICKDMKVSATDSELELLKATDQTVNSLKSAPSSVLAMTYTARQTVTMTELSSAAEKASAKVNKANEYETLMTVPRKDLGDSIKKAFNSVDQILEDLSLDKTESNERAVRILAYNQMDINEESITNMKSYDFTVNQVIQNLTPEVTLTLIKEGKNPLNMSMAELDEVVSDIIASMDVTSEEKFSEYLYNLDRKKELTSEERESYIGIYRLLHQVEKSDGAAVGAVVKANQELTLGNLLTAVRSRNNAGMDIEVDETFGGVESIKTNGASISDQVNKAFYANQLATEVYFDLTVDAVISLDQDKASLHDATLEELYEAEQNVKDVQSNDYTNKKYEDMMRILGDANNTEVLLAAGNEVTVNNMEAVNYIACQASTFYKDMKAKAKEVSDELADKVQEIYDSFVERLGDEDQMEAGFNELKDAMTEVFEGYMESNEVTSEDMDELRLYKHSIRLASDLAKSQMFEVPVSVGDEVVNLKVQMVPSTDGQAKVAVQMSEESFGTLDVTATVVNNELSAFVVCDNRTVVEYFTENNEAVTQALEKTGVNVKQLTVTMNRKKTEFYDTEHAAGEGTKTEVLYNVAKTFVKMTKTACEQ